MGWEMDTEKKIRFGILFFAFCFLSFASLTFDMFFFRKGKTESPSKQAGKAKETKGSEHLDRLEKIAEDIESLTEHIGSLTEHIEKLNKNSEKLTEDMKKLTEDSGDLTEDINHFEEISEKVDYFREQTYISGPDSGVVWFNKEEKLVLGDKEKVTIWGKQSLETFLCSIHKVLMKSEKIEVVFGPVDYNRNFSRLQSRFFPNSKDPFRGDCVVCKGHQVMKYGMSCEICERLAVSFYESYAFSVELERAWRELEQEEEKLLLEFSEKVLDTEVMNYFARDPFDRCPRTLTKSYLEEQWE